MIWRFIQIREALIQARGFLGESVNILNHTVSEGRVDAELFQVLRDDLIQLSRYYRFVASLDHHHWEQWSKVQEVTDSLEMFIRDLCDRIQTSTVGNGSYMVIVGSRSSCLAKIMDDLVEIGRKALPQTITIGSNPKVEIGDEDMTDAMEAAVNLDKDVAQARIAFYLGFRFKIEFQEERGDSFMWVPQ